MSDRHFGRSLGRRNSTSTVGGAIKESETVRSRSSLALASAVVTFRLRGLGVWGLGV